MLSQPSSRLEALALALALALPLACLALTSLAPAALAFLPRCFPPAATFRGITKLPTLELQLELLISHYWEFTNDSCRYSSAVIHINVCSSNLAYGLIVINILDLQLHLRSLTHFLVLR